MSLVKKCLDYAAAHDGALPPFEKFDIPVITAAYKLLYESRYNMLEPRDKALCDSLVRTSKIISTESVVRK